MADAIAHSLPAGRRVLITGAGGQLGRALGEAFADEEVVALDRAAWDVTRPPPNGLPEVDLVLHAAAWTDVDGAEADPASAWAVNVEGTRRAAALGAPLVYFSTDYVFDGGKGRPYVESDPPNPLSVYGQTKLAGEQEVRGGWIVRTSWLFAPWGRNFLRTILALGRERPEVAVVDDQRGSPTYAVHLAQAVRQVVDLAPGIYHLAGEGEASWADLAQAVLEEAGLPCRVRRASTAELGRPAPRPAYSVLRSQHRQAPRLPPWRQGVRECLDRMRSAGDPLLA